MTIASDCMVVGGGLAGAMAALRLAQAGRSVVLLEKEASAHHKVCGEFLSAEAVTYLRAANCDPADLGAAPIHRLRVSSGASLAETHLPFAALSLSRSVLDEKLLARAAAAGVAIKRGHAVDALARTPTGWSAHLADGSAVTAPAVFLATGKHDLNQWRRPRRGVALQPDLVGFKMHFRLQPAQTAALRGCMDLFLFRGGYGGLALVEDSIANLCFVVRRARLQAVGPWSSLLAAVLPDSPSLADSLRGADPLWSKPLAISSIPYGYLAQPQPGIWRLGDQAAVIPSFTGDGMSIALHSGALAARMFLSGQSAADYQRALAATLRRGMRLATLLSFAAVHPAGRRIAPALLRAVPQTMRWVAGATRIPAAALLPN